MRQISTKRRFLGLSISSFALLALPACNGSGSAPALTLSQSRSTGSVATQAVARVNDVERQIAAGNIVPACPTAVLGGFHCLMLILRHAELAPRTEGADGRKL